MSQVIQGPNLRLLFADNPPSVANHMSYAHPPYGEYSPYGSPQSGSSIGSGYGPAPYAMQYRNPQGFGRDEILMVSEDRVLALRTNTGPQRYMSDNVSMR